MATFDESASGTTLNQTILDALDAVPEQGEARKSKGKYRTRLWDFVRTLRAHPELEGLNARQALKAICENLRCYSRGGQDPWADFLEFTEKDEIEFLTTWDKVNFPAGVDYLAEAVSRADSQPVILERVGIKKNETYERFISIAGHLQVLVGPDLNILLPCEKMAEILGVSTSHVSRLRQLAVADGYLVEMVPYRSPNTGRGRSTEFRFRLDSFPELQSSASQKDDPELSKVGGL